MAQSDGGLRSAVSSRETRRAIFLDRDGVLNRVIMCNGTPHPPAAADEVEILPGVKQACKALRVAGFLLIVVTNQPDVARGTQRREVVEAINRRLALELHLHDTRTCYHDDEEECSCRKPNPGLLLDAARDWNIDCSSSFMVGDRWKDIEAGRRAGCTTVLVDYGYAEKSSADPGYRVDSLAAAAEWILDRDRCDKEGPQADEERR